MPNMTKRLNEPFVETDKKFLSAFHDKFFVLFILWMPFILFDSMQQALKKIVQRSDCVDFKGIIIIIFNERKSNE